MTTPDTIADCVEKLNRLTEVATEIGAAIEDNPRAFSKDDLLKLSKECRHIADYLFAVDNLLTAVNRARPLNAARRSLAQKHAIPTEVQSFLNSLRPQLTFPPPAIDATVSASDLRDLVKEAWLEGCRQGYIEGRVADLAPKRERSQKANAAKRKKQQRCGSRMMTLDERDAAIVAEFPVLKQMLGSMEAQQRLADKYGPLTREMVGIILRKAKRQNPK